MPVFALQYELTLYYSGKSVHHLKYAGEADTARRKLIPALALTGLSPVLAQDSTFDPHYDDVEINIRGIQEKTL